MVLERQLVASERLITKMKRTMMAGGWVSGLSTSIQAGYLDSGWVPRYARGERLKLSGGSPGGFGRETEISLMDSLGCKSVGELVDDLAK